MTAPGISEKTLAFSKRKLSTPVMAGSAAAAGAGDVEDEVSSLKALRRAAAQPST